MPEGLLVRVMTKFPIPDIYTNWGMTELSSIATMTIASDPLTKKLKSAGRLLPNFIGKIVDPETSRALPWGQRGEIVVSGFGVMHSYYQQPDRTALAIRQHDEDLEPGHVGRDENGQMRRWMHTGDEGYLDSDGYFVITGRIKDLIIRGGENISPNEIEARLFQHPAIKQCSVFGVPSTRYGEEVAAILELNDGVTLPTDEEIRSWIRVELSRFKAPKYIWWLGDRATAVPAEWPKTANGKLRKDDIRKIGIGKLCQLYLRSGKDVLLIVLSSELLKRGDIAEPPIRASL
jgi:long-chain acyl-CoA synthetase